MDVDDETKARYRERARREVADAPELTDDQREKLRAAIRGRVTKPEPTKRRGRDA